MELHSALTLLIIPVDQESSTLDLVREVPDFGSIQQKKINIGNAKYCFSSY